MELKWILTNLAQGEGCLRQKLRTTFYAKCVVLIQKKIASTSQLTLVSDGDVPYLFCFRTLRPVDCRPFGTEDSSSPATWNVFPGSFNSSATALVCVAVAAALWFKNILYFVVHKRKVVLILISLLQG
jgi:hypothetical protein